MTRSNAVSSAGIRPRGARKIKRVFIALCTFSLLAFSSVASAIDIFDGLNGPFTFDDQPVVADWTQLTLAGGTSGATDILDLTTPGTGMHARVQQQSATTISAALVPDPANPPTTSNGPGRWASTLRSLVSAPTGVGANFTMGKFVNASDNFISDFLVTYDLARIAPSAEVIDGHAVYYSLTGLANSWIPMDDGTGNNVYGANAGSVFFVANNLGETWGNNPLYILWADDNGASSPDTVFSIDNLTFEAVPGGPKEPPPPPPPPAPFGTIKANQLAGYDTGEVFDAPISGGAVVNQNDGPGGTANNTLRVNNGTINASTELVDLRDVASDQLVKVGIDLKTWENSDGDPTLDPPTFGTDFEGPDNTPDDANDIDFIHITAEWSVDGETFQSIDILPLTDGGVEPWPSLTDELKPLGLSGAEGELGPYRHFETTLPAEAETVRIRINAKNNSGSERFYFDNLSVTTVPVPEPASIAMIGLGLIGLVGYGIRRRRAA